MGDGVDFMWTFGPVWTMRKNQLFRIVTAPGLKGPDEFVGTCMACTSALVSAAAVVVT